MKKTLNMITIGLALALTLGAVGLVWAGWDANGCCGTVILGNKAYGIMSDAFDSGNGNENIGCTTSVTGLAGDQVQIVCSATNSAGQSVSCHSDEPAFIKVTQGLSPYSWLYFEYDVPDGECTMVANRVGSPYLPNK